MRKIIATMVGAATLAASIIMMPTATASVAATASTSAAMAVHSHGTNCEGQRVRRCVWIEHDSANNKVRARAQLRDVSSTNSFDVKVNNARLHTCYQYPCNNPPYNYAYVTGSAVADNDGWHGEVDGAVGNWVGCNSGQYYILVGWAEFYWTGPDSGSKDQRTYVSEITC